VAYFKAIYRNSAWRD